MNQFSIWFSIGFQHIVDSAAFDHILFLLALCVLYDPKQWKSLLLLVTAFTIGHSLTLALSVLNIVNINTNLIEFLIPVTIIVACVFNIAKRNDPFPANFKANYWMALFFGFIHGLAFSEVLRSLLGRSWSILSPLFAFNIGLETGQLFIVGIILLFSLVLTRFCKVKRTQFIVVVSCAAAAFALVLCLQRLFELIH